MSLPSRLRRPLTAALAALVLGCLPYAGPTVGGTGVAVAAAPSGVVGPLHVKRNRIVDARGHQITLRGIDRDLPEYASYGHSEKAVSRSEVKAMRSWGANVVRIPLSSALWTNWCPSQHDKYYKRRIDRLVHLVNRQGMVALLVLQVTTGSKCGAPFPHRAPDAGAVRFWKSAAAHYANWPLVAFELFNEPHLGKGPAAWLSGQLQTVVDCNNANHTVPTCTAYRPLGEQQLYDAVESTEARNLVVIDTDGWSADPTAVVQRHGVRDYNHNIVYAVHPYQCSQTQVTCTSNPKKERANTKVLDAFQPIAKKYPIIATEVGWPNPNTGARFYNSTYAYLDRQNPSWGSIAYAWNGSLSSPYRLLRTQAPSYDPSRSGLPVRKELLDHR